MGFSWTDNAATTSTRIRAVHINELRSAVDSLRTSPPCNLGGYPWTDNPVSTTTHIRAVHFTELRSAIQDVWNCHNMGALPNWSVGSAPSTSRQVSARDINDLRTWVDQVDPPLALNGLHWQSPVQEGSNLNSTGSQTQVKLGGGFGSVLILSPQTAASPYTPQQEATGTNIQWLQMPGNMPCRPSGVSWNEAIIVRLLWPGSSGSQQLPANPADLANGWGPFIQWCQSVQLYNFIVLNEPNIEYNGGSGASPSLWNPTNPTYMSELADALRAASNPSLPIYLGFPGPGGVNNPANGFKDSSGNFTTNWTTYWNDYKAVILSKYNNISLHPYAAPGVGFTQQSLIDDAYSQSTNIRPTFPQHPQRFTEYGINIDNYSGGDTPSNRQTRANDYTSFVKWLRGVGTDTHGNYAKFDYILACHVFIARDSSGDDTAIYQLSDAEATTLASGVGCVGQ